MASKLTDSPGQRFSEITVDSLSIAIVDIGIEWGLPALFINKGLRTLCSFGWDTCPHHFAVVIAPVSASAFEVCFEGAKSHPNLVLGDRQR